METPETTQTPETEEQTPSPGTPEPDTRPPEEKDASGELDDEED